MTARAPNPCAMPSMVTSSWVGPTPPVEKTRSHLPEKRAAVRPIVSRSSGITVTRCTSTPRSRNSRQRKVELTSWVFPERTSLPMMMMPAVFDMARTILWNL